MAVIIQRWRSYWLWRRVGNFFYDSSESTQVPSIIEEGVPVIGGKRTS
jgi:hypothetical protein